MKGPMMCPSLPDEVAAAGTRQGGRFDADVVVVGAGPVGLALAADLAGRGASVIVAEQRAYLEAPNVK
jgi:NADPH-dependent 2,4-dienoyl-CoA reductase/sulfur reductase-like enzyme